MKRLNTVQIGGRIRTARLAADLTQARLAESAGIEVQSLSRLERGEYEPSLSAASAVARALGVSLEHLAHGEPSPTSPRDLPPELRSLAQEAGRLPSDHVRLLRLLAEKMAPEGASPATSLRRGPKLKTKTKKQPA